MPYVLSWLLENHLYVKGEKYEVHAYKIAFMDSIIGPEGVLMVQDQVFAVTQWAVPITVKELQCCLGFMLWEISIIASLLSALLKKG